ncbi:MAG: NifU family protein [Chlorobi bacterium]|jgi:Fe-S cluster biogenesis protein NfuA|nr:NifU family protein [Chlorobiota bacterium]
MNAPMLDLDRLREILEREIVPYVEMHGGTFELVEVEGTIVRVRLSGACERCDAATITLRVGIERMLRRALDPAIRVERVV